MEEVKYLFTNFAMNDIILAKFLSMKIQCIFC